MRLISTAINEDGAAMQTTFEVRGAFRPVHVEITVAATVSIQGRAAPDLDWFELASFTATGIETVATMREMRASVTLNTGNVEAEFDA